MGIKPFNCEIDDYKAWICNLRTSDPMFLHIMFRIKDIDASLRFYVDGLGMKLLGQFYVKERNVTALFVGYEVGGTTLELAHYWDETEAYTHGPGYSHIALAVPDFDARLERLETMGVNIRIRPTKLVEDLPRIAFVNDPDGYSVEFFEISQE